jgi:hypothetical protein
MDYSKNKSSICYQEDNNYLDVDIVNIAAEYVKERENDIVDKTPLHLSAEIGDTKLVEIFLKAEADVHAKDLYCQTPLHLGALYGHQEVDEILLKAGVNIHAEDKDKRTSLHLSVVYEHDEITELLLQAGESIKIKDSRGKSALYYMDKTQKIRFGFNKPFSLFNRIYSRTKKIKSVQKHGSTRTDIEQKETVSTTFTTSGNLTIKYEQGASSNSNYNSSFSCRSQFFVVYTISPVFCIYVTVFLSSYILPKTLSLTCVSVGQCSFLNLLNKWQCCKICFVVCAA